jgi:hydroxymethylpyrimidine pyrophosphatase-like HAD family hydrolase
MTDYSAYIRQTAKIVGVSDDHEAVAAREKVVQQELGHQVSAARSQPYYLDVTHPAANKGSVVDFLSAVYLIPASCIAAIGDMPNDILMFEKSGMSIAMGNARNLSKEKLTLLVTETKKKVLRMPWRSLYWGRSK